MHDARNYVAAFRGLVGRASGALGTLVAAVTAQWCASMNALLGSYSGRDFWICNARSNDSVHFVRSSNAACKHAADEDPVDTCWYT